MLIEVRDAANNAFVGPYRLRDFTGLHQRAHLLVVSFAEAIAQ
jgi:hypothetical protein